MNTVYLVSCCGEKLQHPAPARDLYVSQLFKLARAYVESTGERWVILSALWGMVLPDQVVEPYDRRMPTTRASRAMWGNMTAHQLLDLAAGEPTRFVSLCGSDYTNPLGALEGTMRLSIYYPTGHRIEYPLDGLGIGKRLRWLKDAPANDGVQQLAA
jgi:hypothetical protein